MCMSVCLRVCMCSVYALDTQGDQQMAWWVPGTRVKDSCEPATTAVLEPTESSEAQLTASLSHFCWPCHSHSCCHLLPLPLEVLLTGSALGTQSLSKAEGLKHAGAQSERPGRKPPKAAIPQLSQPDRKHTKGRSAFCGKLRSVIFCKMKKLAAFLIFLFPDLHNNEALTLFPDRQLSVFDRAVAKTSV